MGIFSILFGKVTRRKNKNCEELKVK